MESSLARKLATKWQLDVAERRALPQEGMAGSSLVAAIHEIIRVDGRYPKEWTTDSYFDGISIEPDGDGYRIHECRETGMGQFTHFGSRKVASLEEAVRCFLTAVFKIDNVDGIPINWNS